jgi:hypothetical protein
MSGRRILIAKKHGVKGILVTLPELITANFTLSAGLLVTKPAKDRSVAHWPGWCIGSGGVQTDGLKRM